MIEAPLPTDFEELVPGKEYQTMLPIVPKDEEEGLGVWGKDEISPATSLFSYREANPYLLWTDASVTRTTPSSQTLVYLQDRSVFLLRGEIIQRF